MLLLLLLLLLCSLGNDSLTAAMFALKLKEVVIEPNVKLECVPRFCYLGDTLGAGGGMQEAARARVRCA